MGSDRLNRTEGAYRLLELFREDLPGRFNEANILKLHWRRFAALMAGQVVPPFEVLVHPSSACNLACVWCIGDHVPLVRGGGEGGPGEQGGLRVLDAAKTAPTRLPDVLRDPAAMMHLSRGLVDYKKWGRWREEGKWREGEFRIEGVQFSGLIGEPLVCKDAVMQAMEFLVDNGRRVGLFSNAVLMSEDTWDTILRTAYVVVSVDAGTGATYGKLKYSGRSQGAEQFRRMLVNLQGIVDRRASSQASALAINTAYIVYPENHDEIYDAARMLKDIGVDCLRIKRDISGDRVLSAAERAVATEQLERIRLDLVDDSFRLFSIHDVGEPPELERTFSLCTITELMGAVGSDGNLYPCNYHPRPGGVAYGDATTSSFQEVWEGAMRARLKRGIPSVCPKVCDPFKTRSNQLLAALVEIVEQQGMEVAESCRDELLRAFAQVPPAAAAGDAAPRTKD